MTTVLEAAALGLSRRRPVAARSTRTGRSAWLVLAAVLPGMFMNVFDFFAVNVATPVLHRDLGSGPAGPGADRRRLRPHLLPRAGHRRAARRPLRAPPRLLRRHGGVHGGLGAVRPGADERHPGRRPPLPGRGGRDDGPPGAVDHPGELPGAGAPHRPRRLRDDHRRGPGQRPGARRDPPVGQHRRPELAADLPRQPAGGRPHVPLRLPARPGVRLAGPPEPRPGRRRPAHPRRRAADHPDRRGRRPRLAAVVLALPGRRARRRRGVRVVGAPGPRRAQAARSSTSACSGRRTSAAGCS